MMKNLVRLLLLLVLPSRLLSAAVGPVSRFLEDQENGGNNNDYNQDLSMFQLKTGVCFRVKQESDNDDDGNAYFYNGAYRAQYSRYILYELCSNSNGCQQYVTDLESYLENTVAFVQNLCNTCANTCRRLRQLEEEQDENNNNNNGEYEQLQVDCQTCKSDCSRMNSGNDGGYDEANYLECQEGKNENDMQYYTAPQCENGQIVIGLFYDDECTIKTQQLSDEGFSLATFKTIEEISIDCSMTETCANLNQDAVYCQDGYADNDQDDIKLCKAAKAASRVQTYYKKPFYKKVPIGFIFFLVFFVSFMIGFLSYTYYVRHRRHLEEKKPMADLDQTDLPEVS